jgi:hypothetical protein
MLGLEARLMSFELGIMPSLDTLSYYHAFGFFNHKLLSKHIKNILIH